MDLLFPDDIAKQNNEETNFPLWIDGVDESFAPYVPTPIYRVREALKAANACDEDGLVDLGCGDGRFCITALEEFQVKFAQGFDCEVDAVSRAEECRAKLNIAQSKAKFEVRDFDDIDFLQNLVDDRSITLLVTVLTSDFQKKHESFIRNFLHKYEGRRIVSVFFNLENIDGVEAQIKQDKVYVYGKAKNT